MKIFRRTYTKPKPPDAKILRRRSGLVAQWSTRGRVQEAKVTTSGDRVLCQSKCWYLSWTDGGIVHEIKALPDEQATRDMAAMIGKLIEAKATGQPLGSDVARWQADLSDGTRQQLIEVGLIDAKAPTGPESLLLSDLLAGFERFLRLEREGSPRHVKETVRVIKRVLIEGCGFTAWGEIDHIAVRDHLLDRRDAGKGIGKRTFNHAAAAVKRLCDWVLDTHDEIESSPLRKLRPLRNEQDDRRRLRRSITPEEARKLLEVTMNEPERVGMDGKERALLWRFILETGLRRGECRSLTVADLDLIDTKNAEVRVRPTNAKGRRSQSVPIRPPLAAAMQSFIVERRKLPAARVFGGRYQELDHHVAEALKADLEAAGIAYQDDAGRYFDLHAGRYTFVTRLGKSGLDIDTVRRLARHSSITVTQKYMDTIEQEKRAGVNQLPDYDLPADDGKAKRRTGTDGKA